MKKILFTACCLLLTLPVHAQFLDVDVTHPYFHAIDSLSEQGIIKGYQSEGASLYRPLQSINRAEVLKILMLAAGIEPDQNEGSQFPDVPKDAWFTDFVRTAAAKKIVKGYPDGRFYPEAQVTRAEFLKMMVESFGIPQGVVRGTEWFSPYVESAQDWRLLPDVDSPHDSIARGEVAEIIFRAQSIASNNFETRYTYRAHGKASYYNEGFAGRLTANGEIYDPFALTAAHRTLPFGTRLRVYNDSGEFVVVRINDRGPYHGDRVLDLSERAFSELAPISRGVIEVGFEVLSDPQDVTPVIPEQIRPNLEEVTRNPAVPESLYDRLREQTNDNAVVIDPELPESQPLFSGTTNYLSTDFFPNLELRRPVPQKVIAGQVLTLSGRMTEGDGAAQATVFLQDLKTGDQQHFKAPVSGLNFVVAVPFYEVGTYQIGIVFDDSRQSRVAEIEVTSDLNQRIFPASDVRFASSLESSVIPEEQVVLWRWSSSSRQLSRLVFRQGNRQKELVFENGLTSFRVPYDFLATDFGPNSDLEIILEQAESADGTWAGQTTNWKMVTSQAFRLVEGFPDQETVAVLSFDHFSRYHRSLSPVTLSGRVVDSSIRLSDKAYITDPSGRILSYDLQFSSTRDFEVVINPSSYGRYVVEILSAAGEILFNRAFYFNENEVLPVLPRVYTATPNANQAGVLFWTNDIRSQMRRPLLVSDASLQAVAQAYAERMARENFVSHVSPDGQDLLDRVGDLDFSSFGENLAYGSTLELALNGLEDSASHYQNIKNTTWQKLGIGLAQNSQGDYYVVQIFAK